MVGFDSSASVTYSPTLMVSVTFSAKNIVSAHVTTNDACLISMMFCMADKKLSNPIIASV
ncbi:MAG: hypothetical protein LBE98_01030 [Puniceicoccales bacterium]|nr:hypothetical protein [Puniceicoccales bacterium]